MDGSITERVERVIAEFRKKNAGIIDITGRDILDQLLDLPYPESFAEYFKRNIEKMDEYSSINKNSLWNSKAIYFDLAQMQRENGGPESVRKYADRWEKYLSGTIQQPRRITLLEYCIFLRMSKEETYKVLAQADAADINYHNPEEFLAFYLIVLGGEECNLKHYYNILEEYNKRLESDYEQKNEGEVENRTYTERAKELIVEFQKSNMYEGDVKSSKTQANSRDEELIKFMLKNRKELTDGNSKSGNNQYSITQAENLLQMLRYIFVLMGFSADESEKEKLESGNITVYVNYNKRQWYRDFIGIVCENIDDAKIKKHKQKGNRSNTTKRIYNYLAGVRSHIYSVENRMKDNKNNVDPVTRDDVLFFTLMLFIGFLTFGCKEKVIRQEDLPKKKKYDEMMENRIHRIDTLIAKLYADETFTDWMENHASYDINKRYKLTINYVNMFLREFSFMDIYPPNIMDRLLIICLMSEEPEEVFDFICNSNKV